MDSLRENFVSKAKNVISAICGILILWLSKFSLSMHPQKLYSSTSKYSNIAHMGLKDVIHLYYFGQPHILFSSSSSSSSSPSSSSMLSSSSSSFISSSSSSSSSSFASFFRSSTTQFSSCSYMNGDILGTESGVYFDSWEDEMERLERQKREMATMVKTKKSEKLSKTKREYPPSITLLARSGNLPSRMPWVLHRHYEDGRLILGEEIVERHEYIEAIRESGSLIMNLVQVLLDFVKKEEEYDLVEQEEEEIEEIEEEEEVNDVDCSEKVTSNDIDEVINGHQISPRKPMVHLLASSMPESTYVKYGMEKNGDSSQGFTYGDERKMAMDFARMQMPIGLPMHS